ncbi:winged helix-turn-helix transcriptional regulator [Gordonia sp. TBRC 11910]|uniref:Winged helix-turn-helix transcriptional regulator n=1 Tax=Gordonia asplenii TaxID=2725283 RepID=A0A848KZ59_9ACTN|nr:MarR family winged helix-turn-helix transcriptional regulator [Gordonia asplenii]NMO03876.1 winged helix-turn-helix transcriptional regulator [Gordonia asplenii]
MDDPIAELEAELADIWRRGRARMRNRAHAIDPKLDPACYPLLIVLTTHDKLSMSEMVAKLDIEKSTLTRQIDAVVRLGLVERQIAPDDGRVRLVTLTDHGHERMATVATSALAEWRDRLTRWDPDEIRTLTRLLQKLAADEV